MGGQGGLLLLDEGQCSSKLFIFNNLSRLYGLKLIEHTKRQIHAEILNGEPAIRVIHDHHTLTSKRPGEWCRVQNQHHAIIVDRKIG
jgi:hypothetical protein